jgi:hypothetical protein
MLSEHLMGDSVCRALSDRLKVCFEMVGGDFV